MSEPRHIYIGDVVEIEIATDQVSEKDILTAFESFEIVQIESRDVGYQVSIMTMRPDTYEIVLAGQSIVIEVKSTLETIERQDIFEAEIPETSVTSLLPIGFVFGVSLIVTVLSLALLLKDKLKKQKEVEGTAFEKFVDQVQGADDPTSDYFGQLTRSFKAYLSMVTSKPLEGLTSEEVVVEIAMDQSLCGHSQAIGEWLNECDQIKYQKNTKSMNQGYGVTMKEKLISLVEHVEATKNEKDVT